MVRITAQRSPSVPDGLGLHPSANACDGRVPPPHPVAAVLSALRAVQAPISCPEIRTLASPEMRSRPVRWAGNWEKEGAPGSWRPRQDSNLRHRLRRPVLYPLSYGGKCARAGARGRRSTIVLAHSCRAHLRRKARRCRILPFHADGQVARHPPERAPTPLDACRRRADTFRSGGWTSSRWRRRSGLRCSSTTRTICAGPAGGRSGLGRRRRLCHEGVFVPGHGPAGLRGGDAAGRLHPAASSHVALSAGVPAARLVLHGNNKSSRAGPALDGGSGRIVVDSFDEVARLGRAGWIAWCRRPGPRDVLVRVTPGRQAHTHEFVRTGQEDSKFGFSWHRAPPPRRSPPSSSCPVWSWWGCTPTSAARCSTPPPFEQAAEVLGRRVLRPSRAARAGRRRRARGPLRQRRDGADAGRMGRGHPLGMFRGREWSPVHPDLGRAGALHGPQRPASPSTRVRHGQAPPRASVPT